MNERTGLALLPLAALLAALALGLLPTLAKADGEVGIVIQIHASVETHCIAFEGDSISGEEALRVAGHTFEQFGGSARALCAIDDLGCFDASSFGSCFCECPGGPNCTYWAFFARPYGAERWSYSMEAFNTAQLRDGDMHAYKWGEGQPNSAPSPVEITFEEVCGHAPGEASFTPGAPTEPAVTIDDRANEGDEGTDTGALIAFGVVAGVLVLALAGAFWWRRGHGG